MAWKVEWKVKIDGRDLTDRMRPYLMEIEVTDKEGQEGDSCTLTFDDTGGRIKLPQKGARIEVHLDGVPVFRGVVDTVRSTGARGAGRLLRVSGKSFDTRGKAKSQQSFHADDASLEDFLGQAARNAGFSLKVDQAFGGIRRSYWSADGESFIALGQRLARELHGTFKLRGTEAVLASRADNSLPPVIANAGPGGNVISWDIEPFVGRGVYRKARARWFDREKASFEEREVDIEDDAASAENTVSSLAADEDQAESIAKARKGEAERDAGGGSVEMDLAAHAQAEAPLHLSGARPGVDGTYKIVTRVHKATRSGGATTRCEIKQPGGGAGKDTRKARTGGGEDEGDVTLPRDPELG